MNFFDSTLIYPIFDVESIGDGPRVPRAHLEVVFATSHHNKQPTPVSVQLENARLGLVGGASIRCLYLAGEPSRQLPAGVAPKRIQHC
jgi:hypothetical protein